MAKVKIVNTLSRELEKVMAITEEVEASFRFMERGLLNLRSTSFAGANNHVTKDRN